MKLEVRITKVENAGNTKAYATVTLGGEYAIHGIRVIHPEGRDLFVAMPSRKVKDSEGNDTYVDTFHPVTSEARTAIIEAVLAEYEKAE